MPINGGTRMLRARRKDINVKPNRRLDRKSSRGMLFENEELRMRTITINAEVEQGQHALKKLRRENEQLRREMWSLRDEYDKMEKLLRKKDTDEDSDQENSDSDDNYTQTDDSDGEKKRENQDKTGDDESQSENTQTVTKFGNLTSARAFDGLSVIDEQTEETTTQTTESAVGCGTMSRGDSANRTLNQVNPPVRMYDDSPCGNDFPPFYDSTYPKMTNRKKGFPLYENDSSFVTYETDWPDNGYDVRPASPYPYPESIQPSYQRRFQVLQNLQSVIPATRVDENGWMYQTKPSYDIFPRESDAFLGTSFLREKSVTSPISIQIPQDYTVIQDRTGPDVFISDVCAKKPQDNVKCETRAADDGIIKNVEAEIEKIEISEKSEKNPKTISQTAAETIRAITVGKLTTAESVDKDVDHRGQIDESVPCQELTQKEIQQTVESEDMARTDKASTFQSKLMVTLKTPAIKTDVRTLKRVPPVQVPRSYQTLNYGVKPDYQNVGKRCVGYPDCRYASAAGCRLAEGGGNVMSPVQSATGKIDGLDAEDIPHQHIQGGVGLLTEAEPAPQLGVAPLKPIKIPPAPPPRTTSCLGTIIPDSQLGVTALHHRTFRGAKCHQQEPMEYPVMHNPLMMTEPVASSSPTTSPRILQRTHNLSLDNLSTQRRPGGMTTNDESSTEDVSTRKTRTTGRNGRTELPHLNKSVSSPSFGTFLRRKPSEHSVSSMENGAILHDRKIQRGNPQNNVSVSSSSGLDSPTKTDRRKRRVSIKFNKKNHPEDGDERTSDSRRDSSSVKCRGKAKARHEETDVTTSERERTNSVSSRASSGAAGSRRKLSVSSNRTYINDDKIPWCGCWGNGCV